MTEGKKIDQLFAVICYAAAVCIGTVLTVIVQTVVPMGSNLFIYLSYLFPQLSYIGVFAFMWHWYKRPFGEIVLKEQIKGKDYLFGGIIAVALLFFALLPNAGITKLFEIIGVKATVVVPKMEKWHEFLLCGLVLCVLPAIGEELIFRKAFCDGMEGMEEYKTVLLAGLCFSLSHLNPAQTVHQFVLGCVLALVYVKTKNVTVTMLMHFINNALALYLERITGAEFWNNITVIGVCFAVGAVVLGATLFFFLKGKKGKNAGGSELSEKSEGREKTAKLSRATVILIAVLAAVWVLGLVLSLI